MLKYFAVVRQLLAEVEVAEGRVLEEAAAAVAKCIAGGNVLHFFAAGHSHLLGEELFYRAGGLVPVNVLFEPGLMLHHGAGKSSRLERLPGYAAIILEEARTRPGDVMIVASTSGVNVVPVEMALEARKRGLFLIALTSVDGSRQTPARHPSGQRLCDLADLVLDNHAPAGDAAVEVQGLDYKVAPVSTVLGAAILDSLVVLVTEKFVQQGIEPPVFRSANVPGGEEHNAKFLARYHSLIRGL